MKHDNAALGYGYDYAAHENAAHENAAHDNAAYGYDYDNAAYGYDYDNAAYGYDYDNAAYGYDSVRRTLHSLWLNNLRDGVVLLQAIAHCT